MNILETILQAQGGNIVKQLSGNLGISENDAQGAIGKLVPALSRGVQRNAATSDGLGALMRALQKGNHSQYVDSPEQLSRPEAIDEGNAILGHIFGSKDVSRNVATRVSEETGLDAGILKKMLPMLAGVVMGSLGKQSSGGGLLSGLTPESGTSGSPLDSLTSFLDADKDGSIADDLLGMAKKLF